MTAARGNRRSTGPGSGGRRLGLAVVILNFRTPALVIDCVASLADQIDPGHMRIVVVDNASGDGSAERIRDAISERRWDDRARLVRAEENRGFSAGNNLGIEAADADAYLLLNSDTIVRPGAVRELLRAAEQRPEAGIISPRLEWPDGTPQVSTFRYPTPASEFLGGASTGVLTRLLKRYEVPKAVSDGPVESEWTSFACVLVRRAVIEDVGPMDDGYFMYLEDVDYCRRAGRAGWKTLHWPAAHVVHLRGGSSPVKQAIATRTRPPTYYYASRSRYFAKFYGVSGLWLANLLWLAGRSLSLAREWAGDKERHVCERQWLDIWWNVWTPLRPPPSGSDGRE